MSGEYSFLKRREPPTPLDRDNLNAVSFAPNCSVFGSKLTADFYTPAS
jgi:hypothetical protein